MRQAYIPSSGDWIDEEVRSSLRVIQRQRTLKFVAVVLLSLLGVAVLLVTTYLGLG